MPPPSFPLLLPPADLEGVLHAKIPLTSAMGVRVLRCDEDRVVVEAPLAPNVNHMGTAFGGSLHAMPTLAGYGVVFALLCEHGIAGRVILKRSGAAYRSPVRGAIRAFCRRPPAGVVTAFLTDLREFRRARLELAAVVEGENGESAVDFSACFVAECLPTDTPS